MMTSLSKHENMEGMIAIIYGDDPSRMQYKLDHLRNEFKPDVYLRLDATKDEPRDFYAETVSVSLFPERKMIVLANADFLSANGQSNGYDLDKIADLDLDDGWIVYMLEKPKLDGRKKKVKELSKKARMIECKLPDEKNMPALVRSMIKEKNLKMSEEAIRWYIAHAGMKTSKISMELDKFSIFALGGKELSLEDVMAMTTLEPLENVFKMTDALFNRQGLKLLALYRNFRFTGMEPVAICALLASQVRFVYQVRVLMDLGMDQNQIAKELNASSGRVYNTKKNASRFSANELLRTLNDLSSLDQAIKGGMVDKDEGFENFIFEIIKANSASLNDTH